MLHLFPTPVVIYIYAVTVLVGLVLGSGLNYPRHGRAPNQV